MFSKVHGDIKLHYVVYEKEKIVMLDTITVAKINNNTTVIINAIKVIPSCVLYFFISILLCFVILYIMDGKENRPPSTEIYQSYTNGGGTT